MAGQLNSLGPVKTGPFDFRLGRSTLLARRPLRLSVRECGGGPELRRRRRQYAQQMARDRSRDGVLDARRIHGMWQRQWEQFRYVDRGHIEWRGRAFGYGGNRDGTEWRGRDGRGDDAGVDRREHELDEDHRW